MLVHEAVLSCTYICLVHLELIVYMIATTKSERLKKKKDRRQHVATIGHSLA